MKNKFSYIVLVLNVLFFSYLYFVSYKRIAESPFPIGLIIVPIIGFFIYLSIKKGESKLLISSNIFLIIFNFFVVAAVSPILWMMMAASSYGI